MPLQSLIIEDEKLSCAFLKTLVNEFCPQVKLIGEASTVEEAIEAINRLKPDLIFLDIEMHSGTGFDVLERITYRNLHVIFTTAYDHYAIRAIKFSAVDYILKPIDVDELLAAVQKVEGRMNDHASHQSIEMLLQNLRKPSETDYSITLATSEGLEFVPLQQIIRLEASGPYTYFFLKEGKKIMVSKNLKEYEILLTGHSFMRVHNSHIINIRYVKRMIKTDGGYAVMNDDSMVAISPKKKDEFMQQMSQRLV